MRTLWSRFRSRRRVCWICDSFGGQECDLLSQARSDLVLKVEARTVHEPLMVHLEGSFHGRLINATKSKFVFIQVSHFTIDFSGLMWIPHLFYQVVVFLSHSLKVVILNDFHEHAEANVPIRSEKALSYQKFQKLIDTLNVLKLSNALNWFSPKFFGIVQQWIVLMESCLYVCRQRVVALYQLRIHLWQPESDEKSQKIFGKTFRQCK